MQMQLKVVSTHSGVGQINPCHRGRDVIGGVPSCFRRVSSVLIATASGGDAIHREHQSVARAQHHFLISRGVQHMYVEVAGQTLSI